MNLLRAHLFTSGFTAVVACIALVSLLWQIATRKSVAVSVVGAVGGSAIGMIFFIPAVFAAAGSVTGIHDMGRLAAHVSILFAGYAGNMIFVGMAASQTTRRRRHWLLLTTLVLSSTVLTVCLFSDRGLRIEATSAPGRPAVAVYLLTFVTVLGIFLVGVAVQAHRRANEVSRLRREATGPHRVRSDGYLLTGLRVLSLIGPFGGAYIVTKIAYLSLAVFDDGHSVPEWVPSSTLANVTVLIGVAGLTIPLFGPPIDMAARNAWASRTCRRLGFLWHQVHATPNVDLPGGFRNASLRLHLRIAEINDRLWRLQKYMPGGILPEDPQDAAAAVCTALKAEARNETDSAEAAASATRDPNTHAEAAWLLQLSNAMAVLVIQAKEMSPSTALTEGYR
jgi:hypothetical protein